MGKWRSTTWGNEISLEYGKAIRGYQNISGPYRVYGANGPVGYTETPLVDGPGVILGRKGAYRGVQYSRDPFFVIDTAYFVRCRSLDLSMRWLYYAIIYHRLGEIDDGSPIPSTTRAAVYVRDLQVPPLDEQEAISALLGSLDDKIDLNRRLNETLEAMARAIFKDWFVDFGPTRAKTEGRAPYLAPAIWALFPDRLNDEGTPEGWSRVRLRDVAEIVSGGTPSKARSELWDGSVPWISPKCMKGIHVSDSDERVSQEAIGQGTRACEGGSVLVMVRGMGLHQGVRVSQARRRVTFNQDVKALIPRSISGAHLLFAMLDAAPYLFSKVEASGHGTGILPTSVLDGVELTLPPAGVCQELVGHIDPLNELIAANDAENLTLAATRDLLLPKLMSGEIRVKDAERIAEAAA